MKLKNNWRQQTLKALENDYWGNPDYDSHLVKRCHELRKIPLENFTTEDLRIMIGQQISLDYLIPLALEVLTKDLFAEGDFFEGDLLKNVLAIDTTFWDNNKNYWIVLENLMKDKRKEVQAHKFDTSNFEKVFINIERQGMHTTAHWRIWRGDVQEVNNKSLIITCPVRPNTNELLNKIFTLVFNKHGQWADE